MTVPSYVIWWSGVAPWWLSEQVAILCLVFKWLIHPTNWLVSNLQKGGTKISKIMGKPMTCWCVFFFGGVVGRWWSTQWELLLPSLKCWVQNKHEKVLIRYFSTAVFHLNFGFKEKHQLWSQKRQVKKINLYSLISHKLGGSIANKPTSRLVVCTFSGFPGSSWLRGMAMLLPKSLTPFTFGDRVKPLVERDGQVEEGNLGRVGVSKLKTSDTALISQIGNTCLNRFRIQTVDVPGFSSKVSYIIRGYSHLF